MVAVSDVLYYFVVFLGDHRGGSGDCSYFSVFENVLVEGNKREIKVITKVFYLFPTTDVGFYTTFLHSFPLTPRSRLLPTSFD